MLINKYCLKIIFPIFFSASLLLVKCNAVYLSMKTRSELLGEYEKTFSSYEPWYAWFMAMRSKPETYRKCFISSNHGVDLIFCTTHKGKLETRETPRDIVKYFEKDFIEEVAEEASKDLRIVESDIPTPYQIRPSDEVNLYGMHRWDAEIEGKDIPTEKDMHIFLQSVKFMDVIIEIFIQTKTQLDYPELANHSCETRT